MANPEFPDPVKLIVAILWRDEDIFNQSIKVFEKEWGEYDYKSTDYLFDVTDYYQGEMGSELKRTLISFKNLFSPEKIGDAKLKSNEIENQFSVSKKRQINCDIGYLDHNKLVLASCKGAGQKIYIGDGIYADMIARYGHGKYQPFEWSFLDFKDSRYDQDLLSIRKIYLNQLKEK